MACAHHMVSGIKFKVQEMYKINKGHQVRVRVGLRAMPPGGHTACRFGRLPLPQEPLRVQDISNTLFLFISLNKTIKYIDISIVMVLSGKSNGFEPPGLWTLGNCSCLPIF